MKKVLVAILIFTSLGAKKISGPELLFSITRQQEGINVRTNAIFMLLSNGSFSFESTSGGTGECSPKPAGKFKGKLTPEQTKKMLAAFVELPKFCQHTKACQNSPFPSNSPFWKVLGWGKYKDQPTFIADGHQLPNLIAQLISSEINLHQIPVHSLGLESKLKEKSVEVVLKSQGSQASEEPLLISEDSFIHVSSNGTETRLPRISAPTVIHFSGQRTYQLKLGELKIRKGDLLIYAPAANGPFPCSVIK